MPGRRDSAELKKHARKRSSKPNIAPPAPPEGGRRASSKKLKPVKAAPIPVVVEEEKFPMDRSGWLFKKGGTIFQSWSKRWCTLTPTQFSYFSSETAAKARKAIDLKGMKISHSVRDSDDRYPWTSKYSVNESNYDGFV